MQWHHYFIAIGVAVDLYEKFKGRKKTPTPVLTVGESPTIKKENRVSDSLRWAILGLNQGPPDYESVALTN